MSKILKHTKTGMTGQVISSLSSGTAIQCDGFIIEADNNEFTEVFEPFEFSGGSFFVDPSIDAIVECDGLIHQLYYPTKKQAKDALDDINRYIKLRRLADDVNGNGKIAYSIHIDDYKKWACVASANPIFDYHGAVKACELLNNGQFKL
jgi:hypothetical protein